ncbi:MAG: LacI family DNA-binding transcriptional regulator [Alphaproteobacteria bacterium]|nr:LacI family DNA-binding transcriptional regulator [Alphaproteobacteria bacterium]
MTKRADITIDDVAEAAGVSRQTVSRVINRGPHVKPLVRDRVQKAIDSLGYVPNLSARRMAGSRSYLILAINDRKRTIENWAAGRGNDWVDQMLFGGMTECERQGYHLLFELIDTETEPALRQLANVSGALRPDGVILTPPHSDNEALCAWLTERSIPFARIGHRVGSHSVDVFMDEAGAAHEATRGLIALGHSRIAYIAGAPNYGASAQRISGYEQALREAGATLETSMVATGGFSFQAAADIIDGMLKSSPAPSAFICDNDEMAFAALHVAASHGFSAPQDLSVISFEDTPGVRFSVPPLTAVRQPTAAMIARACERLIAISRGEEGWGAFQIPYELIMRDSTGPAP